MPLSSSDAEYIALSNAVNEVMFVIQFLRSMTILVKYPVTLRVDNIGAIFMASNITTISYTKDVNIRYENLNEYVEDRIIKIIFVKSVDNESNILNNYLSAELHEKHSKKRVDEKVTMFLNSKYLKLKGSVLEMMF